jgi:hypothetical protein
MLDTLSPESGIVKRKASNSCREVRRVNNVNKSPNGCREVTVRTLHAIDIKVFIARKLQNIIAHANSYRFHIRVEWPLSGSNVNGHARSRVKVVVVEQDQVALALFII